MTHCGECHTPRNFLGGLERAQWLTGARMPGGELVAPNLTPDKSGLADWSAADIVDALTDGTLPQGGTLGEEMGEVVRNSTSRLRPERPRGDRRLSQSAAAAADAGEKNEMTRQRDGVSSSIDAGGQVLADVRSGPKADKRDGGQIVR